MTLVGNRRRGGAVGEQGPASLEDAEFYTSLVRRVEQGEAEAESELARLFYPRIRLMASARLHGSDAALDLTQETLVAALEALRHGSLREPAKLPAFVHGIGRNLVNNHLRRAARSVEVGGDPPEQAAGTGASADNSDGERRAVVRRCLARLNALDRRILTLTLVEGMTPREIAALVGVKPELVRTRKSRAIQALRDEIAKRDMKSAAGPLK